jgi:hypothetical protein
LGVFGSAPVTGKPGGGDLAERVAEGVASTREEIHDTRCHESVRGALANVAAACTVRAG